MKRLVVIFLAVLLVACGTEPEPTPTITPEEVAVQATPTQEPSTATAEPTRTAKPTSTPKNTATPKDTVTPKATKTAKVTKTVKATKTPKSTNTPKATSTPEPTAAPQFPDYIAFPPFRQGSPEHESVGRRKYYPPGSYEFIHNQFSVPYPPGQVPDEYVASLPSVGPGVCPLSGQNAPNDINTRRPVNVRLDNSPSGRPQAGLQSADVVWEALAEGGITRLTATFHCLNPGILGPIRSARLVDLQLTPMLNAWIVHAGAAQQVTDMIWASAYADRSINEWESANGFYRIDQAPVGWLRTYSNYNLIQNVIANSDVGPLPAPLRGWRFSQQSPRGATESATQISVPYAAGPVNYSYNANSGRYARYQGQNAHTTQSGYHLAPVNIMVLFSRMTTTPIVEDSQGGRSLHFNLQGQGRGLLFRSGQVWDASWIREGENTLIRIVDEDRNVIPMAIGQTWVQIVPADMEVSWE